MLHNNSGIDNNGNITKNTIVVSKYTVDQNNGDYGLSMIKNNVGEFQIGLIQHNQLIVFDFMGLDLAIKQYNVLVEMINKSTIYGDELTHLY